MNKILERILDEHYFKTLTVCGSYRYRNLKEKYQAYYTIKNNLVFAPVNYASIKNEVETCREVALNNVDFLHKIHDKKIMLSDAIIVVVGDECYFGSDTLREINFAYENKKIILFSNVPEEEKHKYYFNNDETYPLYMLKEEYK